MAFTISGGAPRKWALYTLVVAMAFGLGYTLRGDRSGPTHEHDVQPTETAPSLWTCSMHPQIQLPQPGKCPICGMDLIPVESGTPDGSETDRRLSMSATARKLAEVRTTRVGHREAQVEIRLVGKVAYDETRLSYVSAWVPGRLDRLYVDYTGIEVRKGDHMVNLYSPELLSTQQELLEARLAVERLQKSDIPAMRETARATLDAARDRLRLWGLTSQQIQEVEDRGEPNDHTTIYAPVGGIVVEKHINEGMYVDVGTRIYSIADLSKVWVLLDAYESDINWLRYGQEVELETEAFPGQSFSGRISFIDPVLNAKTRTIKVRVNVDNSDGRLKPEMFVRAVVRAQVSASGRVMDPELAGKWICPMHPEVVEDKPGDCVQCGMDLVSAESLGYVAVEESERDLTIPASAVLMTGKRAVVYVEIPGESQPTFEGREVVLGPRAGDEYLVRSGLQEGDLVVVNGAFKIDSALQIQARPSMMSPKDMERPQREKVHLDLDLSPLFEGYFDIQESLSRDDLEEVKQANADFASHLQDLQGIGPQGEAKLHWEHIAKELRRAAQAGAEATALEEARNAFFDLSNSMILVEDSYGHTGDAMHYRMHCPMAFDNRGADWLQNTSDIRNPYYGSRMFRCGNLVARIPAHEADEVQPQERR